MLERVLKDKVVCGPAPFRRGSRGEGRGRGRSALCVMAASGMSRDPYYTVAGALYIVDSFVV